MMFSVVFTAEPAHFQRFGVIIVMAMSFGFTADFAGQALDFARTDSVTEF